MEQDAKKQKRWTIASMVVLILDVFGYIVLAAITLLNTGKFNSIFVDMGVQLPQITQVLVSLPSALYVLIFLGLIIALVLKEKVIRRKPLAFTLNVMALIGGIAFFAIYMLAMFLPLSQIIQSMK